MRDACSAEQKHQKGRSADSAEKVHNRTQQLEYVIDLLLLDVTNQKHHHRTVGNPMLLAS